MPLRTPPTPATTIQPTDGGLAVVRSLVEPLCKAHGIDLVGVAWVTEHAGRALRVTIERRGDGQVDLSSRGWGVTLADCADLSRDISQALDHAEDSIPGSYNLEVSSPGLERDLHGIEDFTRFKGMLARAKLGRPAPDGQRLLRGTIVDVSGDAGVERLTMLVDKKELTVPFADVLAANLVFEMTAQPRPSAPTSQRRDSGRGGRRAGPKSAAPAASGARGSSKRSQSKGSGS